MWSFSLVFTAPAKLMNMLQLGREDLSFYQRARPGEEPSPCLLPFAATVGPWVLGSPAAICLRLSPGLRPETLRF